MYSSACRPLSLRPIGTTISAKKASSFNRNRSISLISMPRACIRVKTDCQDKLNVVVLGAYKSEIFIRKLYLTICVGSDLGNCTCSAKNILDKPRVSADFIDIYGMASFFCVNFAVLGTWLRFLSLAYTETIIGQINCAFSAEFGGTSPKTATQRAGVCQVLFWTGQRKKER